MPVYRIHQMKELPRQQFRWAPHTSGVTVVKLKDYQGGESTVDAATPYAAWSNLRESDTPLDIGDILETEGELRILKYVGFEEARWFVPESAASSAVQEQGAVSKGEAATATQ